MHVGEVKNFECLYSVAIKFVSMRREHFSYVSETNLEYGIFLKNPQNSITSSTRRCSDTKSNTLLFVFSPRFVWFIQYIHILASIMVGRIYERKESGRWSWQLCADAAAEAKK